MAEFTDVMKQAKRICGQHVNHCTGCPLADPVARCLLLKLDRPSETERIVMDWAAANPEPRYPSWKEVWARLFPRMTERLPPCPRYFVERERYMEMCSGSQCDTCLDRPIPADIAEKLGIKPIGGTDDV